MGQVQTNAPQQMVLGSIAESAASLDVARSLATEPAIGSPDHAREITDATAGVHRRAWQRSGVAGEVRRHAVSLWPNISTVTPLQQATRIY
jgi:hypothetical protein